VLASWKIRRLRVSAEPLAGTGRHGHGDWMETDRWARGGVDLLILEARRTGGTPENAACKPQVSTDVANLRSDALTPGLISAR
jgi:hypothetical protein